LIFQKRLTWPSHRDCQRLNDIIFETNLNPFGIAAYNPNDPVTDFVGRREELQKIKVQIQNVINHKMSRSIQLDGPAGVGKSTLFNFLKESIQKERSPKTIKTEYLFKDCDIFSTYFVIPDKISEFSDLWRSMLEGLSSGFDIEVGYDISLPEYIAFHLIYRLFLNDKENIAKIIWTEETRPRNLYRVEFKDIIDPLSLKGSSAVKAIQLYFTENKRELRNIFRVKIKDKLYEIKRADNKFILNLFRVIDEDDPEDYLDLILNADKSLFQTNDNLIDYFNDLMRYYACSTRKQPILLIGIDEAVKADPQDREDYFLRLANLFVKLRNKLNDILFVFISTTEDWASFNDVLKKKTDLQSQLSEFMYKISLTQLSVEEMIQVFKNRMNRFWENYSSNRPLEAHYYPFSENLFEYVYRFKLRDLRGSIHFLNNIWMKFKHSREIPKFEKIFECMREVRKFDYKPFDPHTLKRFEWTIINKSFNEQSRFNSNSARSSSVEKGLENAWKCLLSENPPTITRIENNCVIKTSSGNRRPDVYLEIHGNLGAEFRRNVEFQVKAYNQKGTVSLKHIESSLELFEENFTDFIYFIITGRGLEPRAEARVKELEVKYTNRIRRPVLTEDQENRLYLLALYKEITGMNLGDTHQNDLQIAKEALSFIIGQPVEKFLAEIKNLAYRRTKIEGEVISPPKPPVITPPPIDITSFTEETSEITPPEPPSQVKWLVKYPDFKPYRYEACALCAYLKNRETGRYQFKFTIPTVQKNVIISNALLSKDLFKKLVNFMKINRYVVPEKTSFKLTELGKEFYQAVKRENYRC